MEVNLSSLESNLSNGPTTTATVDQKSTVSSPAATIDPGKSSISEIENDKGNSAFKLTKSQKRKKKNASLESLDKRKDAENEPNTGTTLTVDGKSSVSGMENENDNGAATLTYWEINNLRKLLKLEEKKLRRKKPNASLESLNKREDSGNTNSKPNFATTATVYQKMAVLSPAVTSDEKSSISGMENDKENGAAALTRSQKWIMENLLKIGEKKLVSKESNASVESLNKRKDTENTNSKPNSSTTATVDQKTDEKSSISGVENDKVNGAIKLTKSQKRKMKELLEKESNASLESLDKQKDTENTISKMNDGLGTTETVENNGNDAAKISKRQQRKMRKLLEEEKNASSELLDKKEDTENNSKPNNGVVTTATVENNGNDAVKISKRQQRKMRKLLEEEKNANLESLDKKEDTENSNSKPITGTTETVDQKMTVASLESLDKKEDTENNNSKPITGTTATVAQKMTVASLTATGDGKSSILGLENGKEKGARTLNKWQKLKMEKKMLKENVTIRKNSAFRNHRPTLGEILNPNYLEKLEAANAATNYPALKKKKMQKNENKNLAVSDIMKTCENTQDKVIDIKDSGTTKVLEAINGEMVTDNSVISDAKMVSNVTEENKKKPKLENKGPTLAEILNPQNLNNLETANCETGLNTTETDATSASKKRKRQKLKKNDILGTNESTQDTIITNKDSDTNKPLEILNTESKMEILPEIFSDEKCPKNTEIKEITNVAILGKKLVIFDVNGLLADIVSPRPKDAIADKYIPRRAIFKRPFLDDFLCFCFERFNVAIWSSRTQQNLDLVINFLLGDLKNKLLFLWDGSQCTNTGMRTLEDRHKPVVLKDLRKIWDKNGPYKSWVKGTFNESNTLLLDDSPYKALLNPKHTCIFPFSYSYKNRDTDDFLAPNGELQTYLEGVAATDNLKTYAEQHPFGQRAIDQTNPNWYFYSRILKRQNR